MGKTLIRTLSMQWVGKRALYIIIMKEEGSSFANVHKFTRLYSCGNLGLGTTRNKFLIALMRTLALFALYDSNYLLPCKFLITWRIHLKYIIKFYMNCLFVKDSNCENCANIGIFSIFSTYILLQPIYLMKLIAL